MLYIPVEAAPKSYPIVVDEDYDYYYVLRPIVLFNIFYLCIIDNLFY